MSGAIQFIVKSNLTAADRISGILDAILRNLELWNGKLTATEDEVAEIKSNLEAICKDFRKLVARVSEEPAFATQISKLHGEEAKLKLPLMDIPWPTDIPDADVPYYCILYLLLRVNETTYFRVYM